MSDFEKQRLRVDIHSAHSVHGVPITQRMIPYRNVRMLLSMNAKTARKRPYLLFIDPVAETRQDLSMIEFNARAHQTANLLFEDFGIRRGDQVVMTLRADLESILVIMACWIIGAAVLPVSNLDDAATLDGANLLVVHGSFADIARSISRQQFERDGQRLNYLIIGGTASNEHLHFLELVRNMPTTYLGDETGAKSDDVRAIENEAVATLDDLALLDKDGRGLAQYNLLVAAHAIATAQAINGDQRILQVGPWHEPFAAELVSALLVPLIAGGTSVIMQAFSADDFWRLTIERDIHVGFVDSYLDALVQQSEEQLAAGNGLFGVGVHRRGMAHIRHFIGNGGTRFESTFGFPVLGYGGVFGTAGFFAMMPVDLSWEEHRSMVAAHEGACIGIALPCNDVAILDADGNVLKEDAVGEICVRGHNVLPPLAGDDATQHNLTMFRYGWYHTGLQGLYQPDSQGRAIFYWLDPHRTG